MSEPTKEYLMAKATLCRDLAIKQMSEGEGEQATRNRMRMVKALGEVGIINEREAKMDKWLEDLQENGDDGTGFCDTCAGCPNCVSEGESNE